MLRFCADHLTIYLVRHGETDWTVSGRHNGRTEVPLNAHGRSQSEDLGRMVHAVSFDYVFCSPSRRAAETARIAFRHCALTFCDELREWDYGRFEGKTVRQIRQDVPDWTPWSHGFGGGETIHQVQQRTAKFARRLAKLRGVVAVVSHGHALRILCAGWLGSGIKLASRLRLDPAAIIVLEWEYGLPAIKRWNCSAKSEII